MLSFSPSIPIVSTPEFPEPAWIPSDVSSVVSWYDPHALRTGGASDSDPISGLPNIISGATEWDLSEGTESKQPTRVDVNGIATAFFDRSGAGQKLTSGTFTTLAAWHWWLIWKIDDTDPSSIFDSNPKEELNVQYNNGTNRNYYLENGNAPYYTESISTSWRLLEGRTTGAIHELDVDGVNKISETPAALPVLTQLRFGQRIDDTSRTEGKLGAFVMSDVVLTGDDLTSMRSYMAAKRDALGA